MKHKRRTATQLNRTLRRREDRIVRRGVGPICKARYSFGKSIIQKEKMVVAMMSQEEMESVVQLLRGRPLMKKHGRCGLCTLAKAVERLRPLLAQMARKWMTTTIKSGWTF